MRLLWFSLLVFAVCTPLALVMLFVTEAYVPALDPLTLHEPTDIRNAVAGIAMSNVGDGKDAPAKVQRVLRLDLNNAQARDWLCTSALDTKDSHALAYCKDALALDQSAGEYNQLGQAQLAAGDPCAAEQSFTSANSRTTPANAFYLRNMGPAAYACGHFIDSAAEFSAAESVDHQSAAAEPHPDQDNLDEEKEDLLSDREWLAAAYKVSAQPRLALEACARAHPEWKTCTCTVATDNVSCAQSPHAAGH